MRLEIRESNGSAWTTPALKRVLVLSIAALAVANLAQIVLDAEFGFSAMRTLPVFDLSQETSIGTWFTTLLLMSGAIAAAALGIAAPSRTTARRGWLSLAGLFALLSLDEVIAMHERVIPIAQKAFDLPATLFFVWVIPAVLIVLAFAYWQRGFFRLLPRPLRRRLVLAAAIYVGAAAGLEVVESVMAVGGEMDTVAFSLVELVEEVLEMLAATLALIAIVAHLHAVAPAWTIISRRDAG